MSKAWLRWGLSLVLLSVFVYFFLPLVDEVKEAADLFTDADWIWLAAAILIQVVSYGFLTWLNALALQPFGGQSNRIGFLKLAAVLTAMAFIQIAIPSAGASGIALRVRLLGKFGYRSEESLFSLFVETFSEIFFLAAVALLGLAYLLQNEQLGPGELAWLALVGAILVGLVWYVWRLANDPARSREFLIKWVGLWNRIACRVSTGQDLAGLEDRKVSRPVRSGNHRASRFRKGMSRAFEKIFRPLDLENMERRLEIFQNNLRQYRQIPLWKIGLAAGGKVFLDVASLGAAFLLVGYLINPGRLLTGYGLILTFSGITALPAGIGIADASVPVIFSWLDTPEPVALAAGLVYRLIAFWLVRFVGFISWHYLEAHS